MSVINQVLNELEKRGANTPMDEAAIRAIPPRKQSHLMRYILLAVAVLILFVSARWYWGRSEKPLSPAMVAIPAKEIAPVASGASSAPTLAPASVVNETVSLAGTSGVSGASQLEASLHGKPLLQVQSEEEPVAVAEVKKAVRHKSGQKADRVAGTQDELSIEDIENSQIKTVSPLQHAENEFRKANLAVQEGRTNEALAGYENALLADPTYKPARRAWVGLLLSLKRNDEAERVLQRGIKRDTHDTQFAMMLARLQVERGDVSTALATLQKAAPYAEGQGDFYAFVAALLQRQSRHEEAVAQYQIALKLAPNNGLWLMGTGISLQALQRNEEARAAYQHALATNSLSAQLQAFVQQKLKEL
jgi:MSHA biogenesis protein MshN